MGPRQQQTEQTADAGPAGRSAERRRSALPTWILVGLFCGLGCGLFFGESCAVLKPVGDAFVGLLRMTVLPYIVVSLVASFGRLSRRQARRLAGVGGLVMLSLWAIGLLTVWVLPLAFPAWKSGSFFSSASLEPPQRVDLLEVFIPTNVFRALSDNQVPAVVLLCVFVGVALGTLPRRRLLIAQLDLLATAFIRVSGYVTRLTPFGVFAIAATTAGTLSFDELGRVQAYLLAFVGGCGVLAALVLPLLVASFTPFGYREVLRASRAAVVTAFATGKLIVVLPLLIEETRRLLEEHGVEREEQSSPTGDVLYPLAYAFPHLGKLLTLVFVPFAAWFLGDAMRWHEYPAYLGAGLFSSFGGPLLSIPFLLDLMRLPHDMFQLFLLTGVVAERVGDALGAMHLLAFTLLTTAALTGRLRWSPRAALRLFGAALLAGTLLIGGLRAVLVRTLASVQSKEDVIAQMQLLELPVAARVLLEPAPNPDPLLPGETLLQRIRRRGVIRVGFNEDKLPFAFFNVRGELVGFDVNMAHALARDLGVELEFVRFDRATLAEQLEQDHFDVVMSGLVGTLERAERMEHTQPYLDVTLAFVVQDHRARAFSSFEAMAEGERLRVGFVDLSQGFVERLQSKLPNTELVELASNGEFFAGAWRELDALAISAESGAAFTLLHPQFEAVVPAGPRIALPLFYAVGLQDADMREFLQHWVDLRRKDGTMQEHYDHWVLGRSTARKEPRWSVVRDVLGWMR